jgi:cytochrome c
MRLMPILLFALPLLGGCQAGAEPALNAEALISARCGACHRVPGVVGANGRVGPSLDGFGRQQIIAGYFPNTPGNLVRWLRDPQRMLPGNAMQDTGLTEEQARAVAAYLYSLK